MRARIDAWEAEAREKLPRPVFDYFAGGAGDEVSLAEACPAWDGWQLAPRVLRDVSHVDTSCEVLGGKLASPIVVAPMAYHALAHRDGELASAGGARRAGTLYVMATRATRSLEEVAGIAGAPWWFQVYVLHDRGLTKALVDRAVAAGATALVVTGDTPIVGPKSQMSGSVPLSQQQMLVNLGIHIGDASDETVLAAIAQDPSITEDIIGWLADLSGLPVLVKGVVRPDDAVRCLEAGAAGVVVSNHGARQLDGAVASADVLAQVVDAVAGHAPVLVDGGIRDGRAVLKALCLGASAVMIGRPVIWALAAGGADGVAELLVGLRAELAESMMLAGSATIAECDRSLVRRRVATTTDGGETR